MKKLIVFIFLSVSLFAQNCNNKTFSLSSYDTEGLSIMDLVQDLTKQCGISVLFTDNRAKDKLESGLGLINIDDYSLNELFKLLFDEHNLFYEYDEHKKLLKVSYYKLQNFNVNYINASVLTTKSQKSITVGTDPVTEDGDDDESANSDKTTITMTSTFTFWSKLKGHIEDILKADEDYDPQNNKVLIDKNAAVVTLIGTKRQLEDVEQYLKTIEQRMHSQVMIDAHIIELTYDREKNDGVDWSKLELELNPSGAGGLSANFSGGKQREQHGSLFWNYTARFNPAGVIKFLRNYGDVDIVSNPKVLTLNNQPAVINVGEQLSYIYRSGGKSTTSGTGIASDNTFTLGSIFIGLTLNIIPEVTQSGHIVMRINPVSSELSHDEKINSKTGTRVMPPDTKIKQMSSIVKVKDGQRVLIGGLVERKKGSVTKKVPLLGDIPLLGKLFSNTKKSTKKRELFIVLTPTLIKNDVFPSLDDAIKKRLD